MGGILGGSNTTKVTVPKWLEEAAQQNLARADYISQIGYTPYYGADVAALTNPQIAAMQNTGNGAAAFGLSPGADPLASMPQAQNFGGVSAYSAGPMYDQALAELQARAPGQFRAISNMFIDPVTGRNAMSPFGPAAAKSQGAGSPFWFGGDRGGEFQGFTPSDGTGGSFGQAVGGLLSGIGDFAGNLGFGGGLLGMIGDAFGGGSAAGKGGK